MTEAFICDAVRTPIGRYGGVLAGVRTDDLAAVPLRVAELGDLHAPVLRGRRRLDRALASLAK